MMPGKNDLSAARLPEFLCDALAIRIDTLPHQASINFSSLSTLAIRVYRNTAVKKDFPKTGGLFLWRWMVSMSYN